MSEQAEHLIMLMTRFQWVMGIFSGALLIWSIVMLWLNCRSPED